MAPASFFFVMGIKVFIEQSMVEWVHLLYTLCAVKIANIIVLWNHSYYWQSILRKLRRRILRSVRPSKHNQNIVYIIRQSGDNLDKTASGAIPPASVEVYAMGGAEDELR